MASKKDGPPPRPPAPRLGLDKLRSSRNSGPSISIRFNPNQDDDDDDEELFTLTGFNSKNETLKFGKNDSKSKSSVTRPTKLASSPKVEIRTFPRSSSKDNVPRSILGDIKEKISDKIHDPLNAISRKLEELSPTNPEAENGKDLIDIKKDGSPPLSAAPVTGPKLSPSPSIHDGMDKVESGERSASHSRHSSVDRGSLGSTKDLEGSPVRTAKQDSPMRTVRDDRSRSGSLTSDIDVNELRRRSSSIRTTVTAAEDIFDEPIEDFFGSQNVTVGRPSSQSAPPPPTTRLTGTPRSSAPSGADGDLGTPTKRTTPSKPAKPVAMTLSSLLNKPDVEEEELYLDASQDVLDYPSHVPKSESTNVFPPEPTENDKNDNEVTPVLTPKKKQTDLPRPIPVTKIIIYTIGIFLYFIIPWPPFVSGLIVGVAVASGAIFAYLWFTKPKTPREPFSVERLEDLVPELVPEIRESKYQDGIFRGWMNELPNYDPEDYHINKTHSIYVSLEGTTLRLQRPRHNIPKRGMWDEPQPSPKFFHQRYYNLTNSKVILLPPELVKKRLWSKKYPICVFLKSANNKGSAKSDSRQSPSKTQETAAVSPAESVEDDAGKDFEFVSKESCDEVVLYLFARTTREKEEWYRRFDAASRGKPLINHLAEATKMQRSTSSEFQKHRRQSSDSSVTAPPSEPGMKEMTEVVDADEKLQTDYIRFLARVMPTEQILKVAKSSSLIRKEGTRCGYIVCEPQLISINGLISRIFWDFLREKYWAEKVAEKIQKKLNKIHVPYFIDKLTITDIELGTEMPVIRKAYKPYLDERGLWIDVDIAYGGGFKMALETKVNLMKLKKTSKEEEHHVYRPRVVSEERSSKNTNTPFERSAVTHSDEEDSVESSSDEEGEENPPVDTPDESIRGNSSGKKFLRILDKVTNSKYFQQATENKYIKRAMEGVSNTRLVLSVEVQSLVGKLAINIPPPPTDRFWYGFRTNPRLWLCAKPQVGERTISVTHITDWIEKKLALEFQRVFVMPNMDDLYVPLMFDKIKEGVGAPKHG